MISSTSFCDIVFRSVTKIKNICKKTMTILLLNLLKQYRVLLSLDYIRIPSYSFGLATNLEPCLPVQAPKLQKLAINFKFYLYLQVVP